MRGKDRGKKGEVMHKIAVINQKGGVAKSTTALALGAYLSGSGKRVLYVDLDAQGNLTYTLTPAKWRSSVYDVLLRKVKASEARISLSGSADILVSSPALAEADLTIKDIGREARLKEALSELSGEYDYMIIDTPPSLGILTINALTAADDIVIPAQADIYSLQGIRQLSETLEAVRKYCNGSLRVLGILLTRYQKRAIISREVAELLEDTASMLGTRLFSTRIRECTAIKEAQASRSSIYEYAAGSNAAVDYTTFCKEVEEVIKNG